MKTRKQMQAKITAGYIHPTKEKRKVNLKKQASIARGEALIEQFKATKRS